MRQTLLIVIFSFCLFSCGTDPRKTEQIDPVDGDEPSEEKPKDNFSMEQKHAQAYPDASIEMYSPLGNEKFEPGKVPFEFNIKNFPFGRNRPLMLTINGGNPVPQQQAIFSKEFNTGTYRVVAFLTDEEGLALKEYGNFVDRDFLVGNSRPFPGAEEPYLMVNFPREGEELEAGESLKIDFLVIGGEMEADNLEVLIEAGDFTYKPQKMETLILKGLATGEHTVYVHLLNKTGKEFDSIFSSVRRNVSVK
jgi:hypothetical protein